MQSESPLDKIIRLLDERLNYGDSFTDSMVVHRDSPQFWLAKLEGWESSKYDTIPVPREGGGPPMLKQLVHLERETFWEDVAPAIREQVALAKAAASPIVQDESSLAAVREAIANRKINIPGVPQ